MKTIYYAIREYKSKYSQIEKVLPYVSDTSRWDQHLHLSERINQAHLFDTKKDAKAFLDKMQWRFNFEIVKVRNVGGSVDEVIE